MKTNKYRNRKTVVDGITFDSKKEAARYSSLKFMQQVGVIKNLRMQVPYRLTVGNTLICIYRADFVYEEDGIPKEIVEDVKGMKTDVYRLKKKLMYACLGIEIQEV